VGGELVNCRSQLSAMRPPFLGSGRGESLGTPLLAPRSARAHCLSIGLLPCRCWHTPRKSCRPHPKFDTLTSGHSFD